MSQRRFLLAFAFALIASAAPPVPAQSSAGFRIEEHAFNSGGQNPGVSEASSAGFRITLGSIGEGPAGAALAGPSYSAEVSFPASYAPPGEVAGLRFDSETDFRWLPEPSRGEYNVYRDGACFILGLNLEQASDTLPIPPGVLHRYLVTVENRVAEEGTPGFDSSGAARTTTACP